MKDLKAIYRCKADRPISNYFREIHDIELSVDEMNELWSILDDFADMIKECYYD